MKIMFFRLKQNKEQPQRDRSIQKDSGMEEEEFHIFKSDSSEAL